jgi:hypothetical protein
MCNDRERTHEMNVRYIDSVYISVNSDASEGRRTFHLKW